MQNLADQIQALKLLFAEKIPEKMAEIEAVIQQSEVQPLSHAHWVTLHRLMHTLAGSSGSFGFQELGARASAIEKEIHLLVTSGNIEQNQGHALLQADLRHFVEWTRAHFISVK